MSDPNINPYASQIVNLDDDPRSGELASRWTRLWAALIDALINMAYAIPLAFAFGTMQLAMKGQTPSFGTTLMLAGLGFLCFIAIHGYLLHTKGQTVGKSLLGIRIVSTSDQPVPLAQLLLRRYLPISVVAIIPVVGGILTVIDVLFIFRDDKRCIHDLIADTKVVNAA